MAAGAFLAGVRRWGFTGSDAGVLAQVEEFLFHLGAPNPGRILRK